MSTEENGGPAKTATPAHNYRQNSVSLAAPLYKFTDHSASGGVDTAALWEKARGVAAGHGMHLSTNPGQEGVWHRGPGRGKGRRNTAGAYKVQPDCVHIIDHASGWSVTVFPDTDTHGIGKAEAKRRYLEAERERRARQQADRAAARQRLDYVWQRAAPCLQSAYTLRKRIRIHSARYMLADKCLLVLLQDIDGNIQSAQMIFDDPTKGKKFWPGLPVAGAFFLIGQVNGQPLLICEGLTTGATLHDETGCTVACAMFAGNLLPVALAFRKRHPGLDITVCGDDDRNTPGNPGRTKATEAAAAIGAKVAFPVFPPGVDGTDFNDLHLAQQAVPA